MVRQALLIGCCLVLGLAGSAKAAKFVRKDEQGTYIYTCHRFCGQVRVIKVAPDRFRVFSVQFSGEVGTSSAETAAKVGCKEAELSDGGVISPLPFRGVSQCP